MPATIAQVGNVRPPFISRVVDSANLIQGDAPGVKHQEAESQVNGDCDRPKYYWDGFPQRTGGADMDWDV